VNKNQRRPMKTFNRSGLRRRDPAMRMLIDVAQGK
jgi:hypothetical protein